MHFIKLLHFLSFVSTTALESKQLTIGKGLYVMLEKKFKVTSLVFAILKSLIIFFHETRRVVVSATCKQSKTVGVLLGLFVYSAMTTKTVLFSL